MADRKLSALTELTGATDALSPASDDLFIVVDASESTDADKNKKLKMSVLCSNIPDGTVENPSLSFKSDALDAGFFRAAEDEVGVSIASAFNSKFTSNGFQVGDGTSSAKLHTFNSSVDVDDVVIENTEAGLSEGPVVALYRNSASPAANDSIGLIEFRGEDSAGDAQMYAEIAAGIVDPTATSEDGSLELIVPVAGSPTTHLIVKEGKIGLLEASPDSPIHATSTTAELLELECPNDDDASGANILLYRHRNEAIGVAEDELSNIIFRGHNNNDTVGDRETDYALIEAVIQDATEGSEDGRLAFQVQTNGELITQLELGPNQVFIGSNVATDAGVISTVNFKGANDNSTPEDINYSALVASVVDNADGAEDGRIQVQTMSGGTLATRLDVNENKIGFFGATAAVQSTHVADLSATATTGTLPTADGTMTIADAASPTNAELLEYCRELEAKVNSLLAFASAHGLMASS